MPKEDTQFKPGQSGNPAGRHRSKPITDAIKERLARISPGDPRTDAQRLADVLVDGALGGDIQFIKELLNRVEGKVAEIILTDATPEQEGLDALDKLRERRKNRRPPGDVRG